MGSIVFKTSVDYRVNTEFFEGTALPDAGLFFEFFEMLALISLVLFAYEWYGMLKTCAHKSLPRELTYFTRH